MLRLVAVKNTILLFPSLIFDASFENLLKTFRYSEETTTLDFLDWPTVRLAGPLAATQQHTRTPLVSMTPWALQLLILHARLQTCAQTARRYNSGTVYHNSTSQGRIWTSTENNCPWPSVDGARTLEAFFPQDLH